ncbi:hypothetical protein BWK59_14990 [Flavobacterium davisii]|uniref:Uncharacterized protein n=1 Tax=Flavobacterium davisii TaxID=2906077 RepID=A0A246GET3_9FLAO|nr:hypothetical protein [Flavobacterium davisii]OWP82603.1 hypothetical protein BWK59_14990 [Flavobacterium davisii]
MNKQIFNRTIQLNKVDKATSTAVNILVRGNDNIVKEIPFNSINEREGSGWNYHIPLTPNPSNLFYPNLNSSGSYPFFSSAIGANYFQLISDAPYVDNLNINSFQSGLSLFVGDSVMFDVVYDDSVNYYPEFYNDTCWRIGLGQVGVESDFTGLDFCLNGTIQVASKRITAITRVDSNILFNKNIVYTVVITRNTLGYNVQVKNKKTAQLLVETNLTTNASEISGVSIYPYNKTGSSAQGLFKMGVLKLGFKSN